MLVVKSIPHYQHEGNYRDRLSCGREEYVFTETYGKDSSGHNFIAGYSNADIASNS